MKINIKKIKIFCFVFMCTFLFSSTNVFAQSIDKISGILSSYRITLNGEEQSFKNPIINIDGTLYVPVNEFAKKFDMKISLDKIERKVNVNNKTSKGDDIVISIFVYPSAGPRLVYRIDLSNNGRLSTTVGTARANVDNSEQINVSSFSPKVTRYNNLTDSVMKKLKNRISKITNDEKIDESGVDDGWYIFVASQGINRQYVSERKKEDWMGSDHMFDIVQTLKKHSPIEIVEYNYEDPDKDEYYTKTYQW